MYCHINFNNKLLSIMKHFVTSYGPYKMADFKFAFRIDTVFTVFKSQNKPSLKEF